MNDIRKMDIDELKKFQNRLETTLKLVNDRIEGFILSTCSICETFELAYEDLPEGWKWIAQHILCPSCVEKFNKR